MFVSNVRTSQAAMRATTLQSAVIASIGSNQKALVGLCFLGTAAMAFGSLYSFDPSFRVMVDCFILTPLQANLTKLDDRFVIPCQARFLNWYDKKSKHKANHNLISAAIWRKLRDIKLNYARGADLDFKNAVGWMALTEVSEAAKASENDCTEIVRFLLTHGARYDLKDRTNKTPLEIAGAENHAFWSRIHNKSEQTHAEVIAMLKDVETLAAAVDSNDLAKVNELIATGVIVNARWGDEGWTPLLRATDRGNFEIVKVLIGAGADMTVTRTSDGKSSLAIAVLQGRVDIVRLFLQAFALADPSITDFTEKGIVDFISKMRMNACVQRLVD